MKTLINLIENFYTVKFEREFGKLKITVEDFSNNSSSSILPMDSIHITEERLEDVLRFEKKRLAEISHNNITK
jgi:hypothetical protein